MTRLAQLTALRDRVIAATGPDLDIECDVVTLFSGPAEASMHRRYVISRHEVTASVDAALALCERLLPGWHGEFRLGQFPGHEDRDRVVLWSGDHTVRESLFGVGGNGATTALAIVAAILSALIAKETTDAE